MLTGSEANIQGKRVDVFGTQVDADQGKLKNQHRLKGRAFL